jgi:uncharacterized protein YbbC (DUF1343 family)
MLAMKIAKTEEGSDVLTGADILVREGFSRLAGAKVGLVTNHTGLTHDGMATADALHQAKNVELIALFAPEHGIRGAVDERVTDGVDTKTGLPVHSLYGPRTEPTAEQIALIDTLVFDIQDIGCRFYTYLSTLGHCLITAAKNNKKIVVLDRPNPIGGVAVEGPIADKNLLSFVAFHPIPLRHGMTLGELALLINAERKLGAKLEVINCEGWRRSEYWDETGLMWVNPSPNMRSLTQATLYPGVGMLEFTNISVGRGTDTPFEHFGAPWIGPRVLANALNAKKLPGVRFVPHEFTPNASKFVGEKCGGVQMIVTDRMAFSPVRMGLEIALTLRHLYPTAWEPNRLITLLVNQNIFDGVMAGESYAVLEKRFAPALKKFIKTRANYLRY